jgi:hypothetical protein
MNMLFKTTSERRIELATWGLMLIWVGVWMSVDLRRGVPGVVAGAILLLSALIQRALGYEAGLVLWVGGIAFMVSGLNDLAKGKHNVSVLAIVLVIFGAMLLIRAAAGPQNKRKLRAVSNRHPRPPIDL